MDTKSVWDLLSSIPIGTIVAWISVICAIIVALCTGTIKLYKVFTKHFKISIEMCPDEDDDEECSCDECRKSDDIEFDLTSDDEVEKDTAEDAKDE